MARLKRIKKRDLKRPDEFLTFWGSVYLLLFERYRRPFIIGVLILFVLLLSGLGYSYFRKGRAVAFNREMEEVLEKYGIDWEIDRTPEGRGLTAGDYSKAGEEIFALCKDSGGMKGVSSGFIIAGNAFFHGGDYGKAASAYDMALKGAGSEIERFLALSGVAQSLEAKGDDEGALKNFLRLASETEEERFAYYGYNEISRIYEGKNDYKRALDALNDFRSRFPDSMPLEEMIARMEYLKERLRQKGEGDRDSRPRMER